MEKTNVIQLKIEERRFKHCDYAFKEQLCYMKARDKKTHKMNKNMVHVLSNLSMAMCHAFIKNQAMMLPLMAIDSSDESEDELPIRVQDGSKDELPFCNELGNELPTRHFVDLNDNE